MVEKFKRKNMELVKQENLDSHIDEDKNDEKQKSNERG